MDKCSQEDERTYDDTMPELGSEMKRIVHCQKQEPEEIWEDVFLGEEDREAFTDICKAFRKMAFEGKYGWYARRLAKLMYGIVYRGFGHYLDESDWLSKKSGKILSRSQMAFVQRAYTWSHFACSTTCVWDADLGETICMRSLDWQGARPLGQATRIFDVQDLDGNTLYTGVGVVGMLGALTGVKPGFSIAINYAPWFEGSTDEDMDPTFKLRRLLENPAIDTYDKALIALQSWEVSSPVFLTLCGTQKDEACVVEIGRFDNKSIRKSKDGLLIQTNRFDPNGDFGHQELAGGETREGRFGDVEKNMPDRKKQKDFPVNGKGESIAKDSRNPTSEEWYCGKLIPHSKKREEQIEEALSGFEGTSRELEDKLIETYKTAPVWNWETAYWSLMRPKTGTMRVFARRKSG
ncbi:MAG: hypothetical protein HQL52_04275 [Magnetococcales bacterium]|nr:hypothetical protein [Magnetococcales bacterium]